MMMTPVFGFGLPGGSEWIIIAIVGLLVFGKRLPDVARSLGKGVVEFKRGLSGIEDDINQASDRPKQLNDSNGTGGSANGSDAEKPDQPTD